jgi:hypothetical protein
MLAKRGGSLLKVLLPLGVTLFVGQFSSSKELYFLINSRKH